MVNPSHRVRFRIGTFFVMVLLALGVVVARAQDAETNRHFLHDLGGPFIIYRSRVQVELKLTDTQKENLQQQQPEYVRDAMKFEESLKDSQAQVREQAMQSYRTKCAAKFWSNLKENLKKDQLKRFHELELQHEGPPGLLRPEIAEALKITEEERHHIVYVIQDMQQQMAPLLVQSRSGGNPMEILPKVIQIIEDHEKTVESKLDVMQRKQWQEMRGAPFDTLTD